MQLIKKQSGCLALLALGLSSITALGAQTPYQTAPFRPAANLGFPVAINNNRTILTGGFFGDPALVDGDSVTPISIPNAFYPVVTGMNSKGTIIGSASPEDASSSFSFVLTKGSLTILNIPGFYTFPGGINDRGVVVGSAYSEDGLINPGFIWDSKQPRLFAAPGADYTEFVGINESGTAVGHFFIFGALGFESQVFTLQGSSYTRLNIPGALWSGAGGINNRGEIVGSFAANENLVRGFVYDRGVVTPMDYAFPESDAPAVSFPPEPFDFGNGQSGTVTYVRIGASTKVDGINDRGDIIGHAGAGYSPIVECGGCGLTAADFGGLAVLDGFTGERDGSRTVHVKSAGKPQRVRVPHGSSVNDFLHGKKP